MVYFNLQILIAEEIFFLKVKQSDYNEYYNIVIIFMKIVIYKLLKITRFDY